VNEYLPKYKFCPFCGSQLSLSIDGLLLAKLFGRVEARRGVHGFAQKRLWELGKELGFYSIMEYGVPDLTQEGRRSYIDVIWKSKLGIEFAFEIRRKIHDLDLVTTRKDTNKLQNLVAKRKFAVNVSEMTGKAFFCEICGEPAIAPAKHSVAERVQQQPKIAIRNKAYSVDNIRGVYPKAYEKWTDAEDSELTKGYRDGLSTAQLAELLERQRSAIRARLRKLGLC
jgi:hypothetical protein